MTTHTVVTRTAIAALLTCVLVAPAASADQEASAIQLDCRCKVFKGFEKENVCHAHLEIANGRLSFGAFSTNGEGTLVVGEFMDKPTYSALFIQPSGAPMAVHAYVPDGLDAVAVTMGDFNPDEWEILFDCG